MTDQDKIEQIRIDVAEIKTAMSPIVSKGNDHEVRIRKIESIIYKWLGALAVIVILINLTVPLFSK